MKNFEMKLQNEIFLHLIATLFIGSLLIISCESEITYESLVKENLESGITNDSLFLGYYFGMERQEFRDESWKMNQEGIMTGFVDIYYEFDDLKDTATMIFYPIFTDNKISRIPVKVGYNSWAPWNEDLWTDELQSDLIEYYSDTYGITFRELYIPEIEKTVHVNIEGNREIRIYPFSETQVMVEFIDLHVHAPHKSQ